MTYDEFCAHLLSTGWAEYPAIREDVAYKRCFWLKLDKLSGPACHCNDRRPVFHLEMMDLRKIHPGYQGVPAPEIHFAGERPDGTWVKCLLYSIRMEDFDRLLPSLHYTASRMWEAFHIVPTPLEMLAEEGKCS